MARAINRKMLEVLNRMDETGRATKAVVMVVRGAGYISRETIHELLGEEGFDRGTIRAAISYAVEDGDITWVPEDKVYVPKRTA